MESDHSVEEMVDKEMEMTENQFDEFGEGMLVEVEEANEHLQKLETMQVDLDTAKARAHEATEQYLRLLAEFDNFRKRSRREYESLQEYASEKVLVSLLTVLDDFDRTLTAMEKTDNLTSIKDGITMVTNRLHRTLEKEAST